MVTSRMPPLERSSEALKTEAERERVGRSELFVTSRLRRQPNGILPWLPLPRALWRRHEMHGRGAFADQLPVRSRPAQLPLTRYRCAQIRRCGSPEAIQQDSPLSYFLRRYFFSLLFARG
jgi:hypothetical protein